MNRFLDLAFAMLTSPAKALRLITNEERLKEGFILWIFIVFLLSLSVFRQGPGPVVQFLMMFLFMGAALLVHSAVIDYISGLWGGMGTARGITAGFMAASLPLAFSVIFSFLDTLGAFFLSGIGSFIIFIWSFYLDVKAISVNYQFHMGKSVVIALTPYVLAIIFFLALMAVGIMAAVEGIANIQDVQSIESMLGQM